MIDSLRFEGVSGGVISFNQNGVNLEQFSHRIEARNEEMERVQDDGYWQTPEYLGRGLWSMEGLLTADDATSYMQKRGQFVSAFGPMASFGFKYTGILYTKFTGWPQEEVQAYCVNDSALPELPVAGADGPNRCPYQVALKSVDARQYGVPVNEATVPAPTHTGGFTLPILVPFSTGAPAFGGNANLNNSGNAPTYLIAQIYGACNNPSIELVYGSTSYRLQLQNLTLSDGEIATIDFGQRTVVSNSGGDLYNLVAPGSKWFMLPPGSWQLNFNAFDADASSKVVYAWRNAYLIP